jgi:hypothetical protein
MSTTKGTPEIEETLFRERMSTTAGSTAETLTAAGTLTTAWN